MHDNAKPELGAHRAAVWNLLPVELKDFLPNNLSHKESLWMLADCILMASCQGLVTIMI